jgi:hypothetical protein
MTALGLVSAESGPYVTGPPIRENRMNRRDWRLLSNAVIDGQGGQCLICGDTSNLTCHHVVARRNGGADSPENLLGLCATDHTTLHLVDRDVPFRSRLIIAVMVIFGPCPAVCRFMRLMFPFLIRQGIGFHPAGLRLRRCAATATMAVLACLYTATTALAQAPPSPDAILVVQEREAHERAVAERVAYQVSKQLPRAVVQPEAPRRHLSPTEVSKLATALEAYFRVNGGRVPIFWTPEGGQ